MATDHFIKRVSSYHHHHHCLPCLLLIAACGCRWVQVVSSKIRVFLFLLMVCYTPAVVVLLKATIPLFDWNDTHTTPYRRPYNYQVRGRHV